MEQIKIRDFVYMDIERLKSILSQLNKGLPEQTSQTLTESDQDSLRGEGGITGFFKLGADNKYLWQTQSTESKSLHDHIYNFVEKKLIEHNNLINIPGDFSENDVITGQQFIKLKDTSFVLITGRTFINDFSYMRDLIERFNEMAEAIAYGEVQKLAELQQLNKSQKKQLFEKLSKDKQLDNNAMKAFKMIIDAFFKDRTVIKFVPFHNQNHFRFVGTLKKDYLRENIHDIIYKYGTSPASNWHMFAQVASIPKQDQDTFMLSGGNEFEEGIQSAFEGLRGFEKVGLTVSYPEISVTPLAIYRE